MHQIGTTNLAKKLMAENSELFSIRSIKYGNLAKICVEGVLTIKSCLKIWIKNLYP